MRSYIRVIFRNTFLNLLLFNIGVIGLVYFISPRYFNLLNKAVKKIFLDYDFQELNTLILNFALCFAVEAYFLGWKNSSLRMLWRPSKSSLNDLFVAGYHILGISAIFMIFFSVGTSFYLPTWVRLNFRMNFIHNIDNVAIQFAIWLLVYDFLDYCYHRTMHKVAFLWEAHKFHHAVTDFNMIAGARVHALEDVFRLFVHCFPMALLGSPLETYFAIMLFRRTVDIFQHSMLNWDFGWVGRWLLYSPIGHRIHHSTMDEHIDKNFGNIMPLWDRLFGTWYAGNVINETVDVTDNHYNKTNTWDDYLTCFQMFVRRFLESLKTNKWILTAETPPLPRQLTESNQIVDTSKDMTNTTFLAANDS